MAHTFELPDPGEGIHEAEVVEVHVSAGDRVEESDILLDVETDKAVVEVPSPFTGRIEEVLVDVGDDVRVGEVVLKYADGEGEETGAVETASGHEEPGDKAAEPKADEARAGDRPVPAAPATRRLARELDVDLRKVEATGPEGRVTRDDVRAAAEEIRETGEEAATEEVAEAGQEVEVTEAGKEAEVTVAGKEAEEAEAEEGVSAPAAGYEDPETWGAVEREPLRSVRRTIARRMAEAWRGIPHVTHVDHADITELEGFRAEHDDALEDADLTLTVFLLKALVAVLKEFPRFNARLDEDAEEIACLEYHHIGVAVDTDRGLLVPVVRDVAAKSLQELAVEVGELTEAARDRGITRDQMRGGSFTLTNPGPLGGDVITPIINPPQVAILGVGRATKRPVVVEEDGGEDRVETRLVLPLCLSFDHRVNDGADAARFTRRLAEILEDPAAFVRHL